MAYTPPFRVLAKFRGITGRPVEQHNAGLRAFGRRCWRDLVFRFRRHGSVAAPVADGAPAGARAQAVRTGGRSDRTLPPNARSVMLGVRVRDQVD